MSIVDSLMFDVSLVTYLNVNKFNTLLATEPYFVLIEHVIK